MTYMGLKHFHHIFLSQSEPASRLFSRETMQQTGTVKDTVSSATPCSPINIYSTNPPTYSRHVSLDHPTASQS